MTNAATMSTTTSTTPQRPPTTGSFCSSDGAGSPPPNLDAGATTGGGATSSSRSQTPSKPGGSGRRPSASGGSVTNVPWKTGGGGGGGTVTGAVSAFRPPQSQGIPIAAAASGTAGSRRGALHRRSSRRTNSFGGGGGGSLGGAAGMLSSPFSGPGSFLRSAAIFSSQHSSLNSWSVWNPDSFDSRFGGREGHLMRWGGAGDGVPSSSASHSLRSWVWVRDPGESDLSGTCKSVCLHDIVHCNLKLTFFLLGSIIIMYLVLSMIIIRISSLIQYVFSCTPVATTYIFLAYDPLLSFAYIIIPYDHLHPSGSLQFAYK